MAFSMSHLSANSARDDGAEEEHAVPNGPDGTANCGAATCLWLKSSAAARLFADASRTLNDCSPQRHSIMLSIEVWSNEMLDTEWRGAEGAISSAGTRKPKSPLALPASRSAVGTGPV